MPAAAVGVLATVITTRPTEFRIGHSRTVAAPPDVVHVHATELRKWSEWSPWERKDPL